ncbi:MAG: protein-glutamate O-methyltransferase CheR [Deltaproteobacteria bacterium]|nr:protein-glutamate O-methyltransferase CheR [Deltaproteobacteria bacterium]
MSISDKEFSLIRELVHDRLGIVLSEAKKSLVVGRLQKIIRSMGLTSFKHYYDCLVTDKTGQSLDTLVNRITTNHTFFNRENAHFDYFRSVALPEITAQLKDRKSRDIRIWCAGCSSGEEPYMLAMIMLEFFGTEYSMWNAGVLATDISTRALNKAIAGIYSDNNIEHLPAFARKHFIRSGDDQWRICDKVKKDVTFRRFNLMNASFPFKEPFQVIFCRNVMIYFDRPTRAELVRKFYGHLVSGGHLLIGHSETLGRLQDLYAYVMPAVYRRR